MVKKLVSYDTDTGELSTDVEADLAQRFEEKLSKADADATYVRPDAQQSLAIRSPQDRLADTNRLRIVSFQKQESQNQFNGGETVWLDVDQRGKSMLTWRLPMDPENPRKILPEGTTIQESHWKRIVWAGAHWFAQDKPAEETDPAANIHGHWSVEVPDVDMSLRTRFQIFYNDRTDPTTIGTSAALISTNRADFAVVAGDGLDGTTKYGRFVVQGGTAHDSMVEFASSMSDNGRRWKIGKRNTSLNFVIDRFGMGGELLGTPMAIERASGAVSFGSESWRTDGFVQANHDGARSSFMAVPTAAYGAGAAAFKAQVTSAADSVLEARVGTATYPRLKVNAAGRLEWSLTGNQASDISIEVVNAGRLQVNGRLDLIGSFHIGAMTAANSSGALALSYGTAPTNNPSGGSIIWSENAIGGAAGPRTCIRNAGNNGIIRLGRQPAIPDATDATDLLTKFNTLLAYLREGDTTLGLIAA